MPPPTIQQIQSPADSRITIFRRFFSMNDGQSPPLQIDSYAIQTKEYILICDTQLCPEDAATIYEMVEPLIQGRKLLVINSHADWDHCWGNSYFSEVHNAPIIGHELCRSRLLSHKAEATLKKLQQTYPIFQSVHLIPPTLTFKQALTIEGGDLTVHLIPAPGHQPDHIVAWLPDLQLLLAFDTVEMPLPSLLDAAAVPQMFATLEHLLSLHPQKVYPSHGQRSDPALLEQNYTYLREIERLCKNYIRTHSLREKDQTRPSPELIDYSLEKAIPPLKEPIDMDYYRQTHADNVRFILQWVTR